MKSLLDTLGRLFLGRASTQAVEPEGDGPPASLFQNYAQNPWAVFGLVTFLLIFLLVFGLSALFPLDVNYQDTTQQDVPPGFSMDRLPGEMKVNPRALSVGPIFSVGADGAGNLYTWGQLTQRQRQIPADARDIVAVSAGFDHFLALDGAGRVYTWGSNRFGLERVPAEVSATPIRQVVAGHQFSLAVSEAGELFFWGNENLIELSADTIPQEIQGHVISAAANSSTILLLLDDGSLYPLGRSGSSISRTPVTNTGFTQIAVGDQAAIALTEGGYLSAWGNDFYGLLSIPPEIQGKVVSISAGRFHFAALLEDGSLVTWGRNQFGQTDLPKALDGGGKITSVTSGYFLNYAVDEEGTVHPFGLRGYLMGTDGYGRDVFLRLLAGGRLTLTVGAVSVLLSVSIGILVGGLAGYYGGKVDLLLMRFAEIVGSIPFLPLAMTLSVLVGSRVSETNRVFLIMVILGLLSWPGMAQLVRGQVLAEREKEFVLAARATGIREGAILFRHILPNILTPILISATLSYALSMLTESSLSFLGFGVSEPNATWGNMLTGSQSSQVLIGSWWRWVFPSLALALTTISINLIGDGLRSAIDPRSTKR